MALAKCLCDFTLLVDKYVPSSHGVKAHARCLEHTMKKQTRILYPDGG